jgi:chloride channel protein, CIC family
MFLAALVGICTGFAAIIIKNSVRATQFLLTHGFARFYENYLYFIYPTIGILIAIVIMKFIIRQRVGHGIPSVLLAISRNNGNMKPHHMFSSVIGSAFTVGFGGSVGLEGPTVVTGAAIGSNVGRLLHLNYKKVILLIGCACAGAISAIFKSPIAAIIFALEVLMLDLTMAAIVPLLIASVSAALVSFLFLGQDVIYPFRVEASFNLMHFPFYILLGILTALISLYFAKIYMGVSKIFEKIPGWHWRLLIGGGALGVMIFLFPALYGEGYEVVNSALEGNLEFHFHNTFYYDLHEQHLFVITLLIILVFMKAIATAVTFGAGGIGGVFAPSLFIGSILGLFFALLVNEFNVGLPERNFALVGMAGMIAGVIHAPLTAIFLIAEITGGYQLFMPLMIVSTISYVTIKYFMPNSIYTSQLAKKGQLLTHHKDKAILSLMKVGKLIEKDFKPVDIDATLGDLVNLVKQSKRNVFPVLDKQRNLMGIVHLNNIRDVMFNTELYDTVFVKDLMHIPFNTVAPDDNMESVARQIHDSGHFNIPVVKNGKYIGFVSKANVFSSYRRMLRYFSED